MNAKAASARYQRQVLEISKSPGNDSCADCKGRNPRWASWNLGIFLCLHCAGIHRKLGTHITKVKSLTLDEWNKDQVETMRQMGNIKSNEYFNPDERRNRPPANVEEGERSSDLEKFIRDKYQFRRFMNKVAPPVPIKERDGSGGSSSTGLGRSTSRRIPNGSGRDEIDSTVRGAFGSRSSLAPADGLSRSRTAPIVPSTWREAKRAASPLPALPPEATPPAYEAIPNIAVSEAPQHSTSASNASLPTGTTSSSLFPSAPVPPQRASSSQGLTGPGAYGSHPPSPSASSSFQGRSSVFDDLISLSQPQQGAASQSMNGSEPWQQSTSGMANPWSHFQQQPQQHLYPMYQQQPQQTSVSMSPFTGSMNASSLGGLAFAPQQQQQQQQQPQATGFGGWAVTPNSNLQTTPSPSNPFYHQMQQQSYFGSASQPQQVQQQQPQWTGMSGGYGGSYLQQQQQQQQQYQQTMNPAFVRSTMDQQRLQSGQVFDDWAKNMMPSTRR